MPDTNRDDGRVDQARATIRPALEAIALAGRTPADPADRLIALHALEEELARLLGTVRAHKRATVAEIRIQRPDLSNAEIGKTVGLSGERIRQLAEDL